MYDPEYIRNNNGDNLELNITDTLFLDTLLCQIRGITIDFSRKLKKKERQEEEELIDSLKKLALKNNYSNTSIDNLNSQKSRLENIRENRIKGSMIRSRAQLNKDREKPSKYFLNLEKRNYINKSIPSLIVNDITLTDSKDILREQHKFYSLLYSSKGTCNLSSGDFAKYVNNTTKLTNYKKDQLEIPYTINELEFTIRSSKINKAPGPAGFSNEFFKFFLEDLKTFIFRCFQESFSKNKLSASIIEGTITYIPKGDKLRNDLKNWRPLTLLNSIYKIFSSMIAN